MWEHQVCPLLCTQYKDWCTGWSTPLFVSSVQSKSNICFFKLGNRNIFCLLATWCHSHHTLLKTSTIQYPGIWNASFIHGVDCITAQGQHLERSDPFIKDSWKTNNLSVTFKTEEIWFLYYQWSHLLTGQHFLLVVSRFHHSQANFTHSYHFFLCKGCSKVQSYSKTAEKIKVWLIVTHLSV